MDFTVLVKVVADRERLGWDPTTSLARRDPHSAFLNPFDQRAIRVALELRRPGEKVTALSLGPADAADLFAEVLKFGVDRAILVSDDRCAGSDALATARALATAVHRLGRSTVVVGDRSTDGETGLVPAALASLLWSIPAIRARAIERVEGPATFDVTTDTERGWARWRIHAPCLISVGEKIGKPPVPSDDRPGERAAIERWNADQLGSGASPYGRAGSRTTVVAVRPAAPGRSPRLFAEGSVNDRIGAALDAVTRGWSRAPAVGAPLPTAPARPPFDAELLVLATGPAGTLEPRALAVLTELRRRLPDHWPSAVWIGPHPRREDQERLRAAGALRGYGLHGTSEYVTPVVAALGLERELDRRRHVAAVVVPATLFGREVVGRLAARRHLGAITDAEEVALGPAGQLVWTKPSFGGRTVADVVTRDRPSLVSYRARAAPPPPTAPGALDWIDTEFAPPLPPLVKLGEGGERGSEFGEFETADLVLGVGTGVGGPEAIRSLLPPLATARGALAASRKVVDRGWVPVQLQVGLTGRSIAPDLGLLAGASGRPNFLAGWRRARRLLAINVDPAAPIFAEVDVGLVGRLEECLPELLDRLPR